MVFALILNSFKKESIPKEKLDSSRDFISALNSSKEKLKKVKMFGGINTVATKNKIVKLAVANPSGGNTIPTETIYINTPIDISNEIYQVGNLEDVSNGITQYNATIQYSPTEENENNIVGIPLNAVNQTLDPLILEAKNYLYNKNFTERDIQNRIAEYNGTEQDLVPYVMILADLEQKNAIAKNHLAYSLFFNSAYAKLDAKDYINVPSWQ